jgi:hypothetical protein
LTLVLDGGEWSDLRPSHLTPEGRAAVTRSRGDWIDPRVGMNAIEKKKSLASAKNRTPIVHLEAHRHITSAVPIPITLITTNLNSETFFLIRAVGLWVQRPLLAYCTSPG